MADKTLTMTMLFDFFGDLLTEKQRLYFDLYYNEDLSLSEIAEQCGISRQGVRDNIIRAENILLGIEHKTGILYRFNNLQSGLTFLEEETTWLSEHCTSSEMQDHLKKMTQKIQELKG